ncbi:MAG TPA: hypothetical protein VNQ80_08245 [Parapedobacter sp.]|uniref:hypothetical protein n=1 Tax=Parapedobacter sp. TaxID=1958893 RepID=UPI002B5FEA09|nr:hypothetical protein [Parapedobacter sp.]HWK57312.1 hypothetical protein [Parapedobacter sp.]
MPEFPHLPLREALIGDFKFRAGFRTKASHETTQCNLENKAAHGAHLSAKVDEIALFPQDFKLQQHIE